MIHCKLQTRPVVKEGSLHEEASNCQTNENLKSSYGPQRGTPTPRRTGRLTVGRKINFELLTSSFQKFFNVFMGVEGISYVVLASCRSLVTFKFSSACKFSCLLPCASPLGTTKHREPHKLSRGCRERGTEAGVTIWARQVERPGVQTANLPRAGMEGGQSRQPVTMETIIKGDTSECYCLTE
jgi:hypothetical protein